MNKIKGILIFFFFALGISLLLKSKEIMISEAFHSYQCLEGLSLVYFLFALILMPLNWGLEAIKWKEALSHQKSLSFSHSFYSILIGVSAGIFTPARIGEYAGRMALLNKADLAYGSIATFVSSLLQLLVTVLSGSVASIFIFRHYEIMEISQLTIISGSVLLFLILLNVFLFLPQVFRFLSRFQIMEKFLPDHAVTLPGFQVILKIFLLSALRYAIYSFQFVLVFYCFDIDIGLPLMMAFVSMVFLCQSILPLPPVASLIGRGGIALLLFHHLGLHEFVIISATLSVWVINLLLPAFCGMILMMNIRKLRFVHTR